MPLAARTQARMGRRGVTWIAVVAVLSVVPIAHGSSRASRASGCFDGEASLSGSGADDTLRGTPGRDVIHGGAGDDLLIGLGGEDDLCGGRGHDTVVGGRGDDRLAGSADRDHLFGGTGADRALAGPGSDLLFGGRGGDTLDGENGTDSVSFTFAQGVTVRLDARSARGEGNDLLRSVEDVVGSDSRDVIVGDERANHLQGAGGDDVLRGLGWRDRLDGGGGADRLNGGSDTDAASFGGGPSRVALDLRAGRARGHGIDELMGIEDAAGTRFDDRLAGDDGPNSLYGGLGDDRLIGRSGDDFLEGDGGRNRINGGPGDDDCEGGIGRSCESFSVSDPATVPLIVHPRPGQRLANERFDRVRGRLRYGITPSPRSIQVALRLLFAGGCAWWNEGRDSLVPGPCSTPRWHRARFESSDGRWRYAFGAPLPPGRYRVEARGMRGGEPQGVVALGFALR